MNAGVAGNLKAARAVSRCYGALFFAIFGEAWLLLAAWAFGHLSKLEGGLIAAVVVLFIVAAMRLQRPGRDAGKDAVPAEEQRRNDHIFGIVNAATWITVFLVFLIFPRIGHEDLAIPAVAVGAGLALWMSAAWALKTAVHLLGSAVL